jgi:signal transduction histidine kinase
MSSIKPIDRLTSIEGIIAQKYRSVLLLMGLLLAGLWLSLTLYALNDLYRQMIDRMYSWVLVNKERVEEAVFLENFASLGLRLTHVSSLSDTATNYEMGLYRPDQKILLGEVPFPGKQRLGFSYDIRKLEVVYFDALNFAGKGIGFLYLRSRAKPHVVLLIVLSITAISLGIFFSLRRLLDSFRVTLEDRIVVPVVELRKQMGRFQVGNEQTATPPLKDPAREISDLYDGYGQLMKRVKDYAEVEVKRMEADTAFRIAAQTAHDIRSPLAALKTAAASINQLPEDQRNLIRMAVKRINDIAENLIENNRVTHAATNAAPRRTDELLISPIEDIVSEKRAQFGSSQLVALEFSSTAANYPYFASVNAREFKRLLSNLINNAYEAIPAGAKGKITIELSGTEDHARILISDDGKGIPSEIMPRLTEEGFSHGKEGGSGLGLYHMKQMVESWSGKYAISSSPNAGTTVEILLPRTKPPEWFVPQLEVRPQQTVLIVDDDDAIHQLWQSRFGALRASGLSLTIIHLFSPHDFDAWLAAHANREDFVFLVDYEFQNETAHGIELVERNQIATKAVLVTARHEEADVRAAAVRLNLRLLPKTLASLVPIVVVH